MQLSQVRSQPSVTKNTHIFLELTAHLAVKKLAKKVSTSATISGFSIINPMFVFIKSGLSLIMNDMHVFITERLLISVFGLGD